MLLFVISAYNANGQILTESDASGEYRSIEDRMGNGRSDSVQSQHKQIPRGIKVWTIDPVTGDRYDAVPDTTWYMRQNYIFDEGLKGEYNTLGNNGSARINRIFTDRNKSSDFMFVDGYDFFMVKPKDFHFTNTYSPITNLQYNTCGNRTNGEDNFKAYFAVNAGRRIGAGFKVNYMYDRGYYDNQHTSQFDYTMYGSYLGDQYQAHLLMSMNYQKASENGGILNDDYVTHPQLFPSSYSANEIPTQLSDNFNRNRNQHIFFNHRYSVGFYKKVKMTDEEIKAKKFAMDAAKEKADREAKEKNGAEGDNDDKLTSRKNVPQNTPLGRPKGAKIVGDESMLKDQAKVDSAKTVITSDAMADSLLAEEQKKKEADMWMKRVYVPVTSFFHTIELDNYSRNYDSNNTPTGYYGLDYYAEATDSTFEDESKLFRIHNTFGVALLEGFNKWAAAGIKVFGSHYLRRYKMPQLDGTLSSTTESDVSIGAQLSRQQGKALHFNLTGEFFVVGKSIGDININGRTEVRFPLLGDTIRLGLSGGYNLRTPSFFMRHYHSRHFWWDDDLKKEGHAHVEGQFMVPRTGTTLRVAYDNFINYTYLGTYYTRNESYRQQNTLLSPMQLSKNLSVVTVQLMQNFKWKIFHLDNTLTYQKSTDEVTAAVPAFNLYSALYIRFKIARVLDCDFGGDIRYYTRYYAPEYAPQLASYVVQQNPELLTKTGNHPFVNVFLNFQLKYCRFFIMFSHVNGTATSDSFVTPHNPMNQRILRFGLNWNFYN